MAIISANVPVPVSGDGPIVNISAMVGAKTVVLSGFFQGTYTLLASHDNATFVPVLTFDSDGLESIKQTLSEAYISVRVRTNSNTVPASVVKVAVSSIQGIGSNLFSVLTSLPVNASGPQAVIDTAILFPPSGLEQDINFICTGNFIGSIIIEGSSDGIGFNQIGSFTAGAQKRPLIGLTSNLEFSPLATDDKVRYVRINVQGQILAPTVITIGGAIVVSGPSTTTTLAQAYANGIVPTDQLMVESDAHGGGIVVDGSGAGFTGTNAFDVKGATGGEVVFPRIGGFSVVSSVSKAANPGVVWNEVDLIASTLTLTGPPAVIATLSMVHVSRGVVMGAGNSVSDSYDVLIDAAPTGTATVVRAWSLGAVGAIQAQNGLVLGAGLSPPGENDLVFGAGAIALSQANTGRFGYLVGSQEFMVSMNGAAYVPLLTGPAPGGFQPGSVPFGGSTGSLVEDNVNLFWDETNKRLGVDVAATPTAKIHVAGVTAVAGTASLKIDSGVVLTVTEKGAVESDGVNLYWTDNTGARLALNNSAAPTPTLASVYAAGAAPSDQDMVLLDANGGGVIIDARSVGFTGLAAFAIANPASGVVVFPRIGGIAISSNLSEASAPGAIWNEIDFSTSSTLTLTGAPGAVTRLARMNLGQGAINGPGNTVADAYDLFLGAAPTGTTTLTRSWSAGSLGAVQFLKGLVLGAGLNPPGESDLVIEAGATVVSEVNTGRLGYFAGGTQQFMVSMNGAAYVPLLTGPAPGGFTTGSIPFGSVTGSLTEDNAALFWDDTGKFLGVGTNGPSARLTVAGGTYVDVAGTRNNVLATATFAPVGGTAAFNAVDVSYVVDQTGGANGRVTGLLIAATETAVGGLHYPIDVYAGVGGVTEIFRLTNTGTVQTKQGMTLGLGLTSPGESDLVFEGGATAVSQANSGRLGYIAGATQKFVVSQNGAAYVPLLTAVTLAQAYGFGTVAADQTLALLDANGGGFIIDGTAVGFTGTNTLAVKAASVGTVLFPRVGGLSVVSTVSVAAAAGSTWNEVDFQSSTLTLTGSPAVATKVSMVHVGQGVVNGAGNTVTDAYNQLVDAAPTGTATLMRSWSAGFTGAVQAKAGLVLGTGLAPPTENDLVAGAGATVVSEANSGRLGYITGASQQFYVSLNTGAYVPLLVGPAAGGFTTGSVPFGIASGQLSQDNTNFFWDNTNKRLGIGATPTATLHIVQPVVNALVPTALLLVGGAHTAITAGTEDIDVNINLSATKTWATGAIVTQRDFVVQSRTYAFAAASVVTTGATLAITGAPVAGANATITTLLALWVQSGSSQFVATQSVVSAVGAVWNGVNFATSTLTLTGVVTPITELIFTNVAAPTITSASAITVGIAASFAIAGSPTQAGSTTITNPLALHVQSGVSRFSGNVGINTTIAPATKLEIVDGGASTSTSGNATNSGSIKITNNNANGPESSCGLEIQTETNYFGSGQGAGCKFFSDTNNRRAGISVRAGAPGWTTPFVISEVNTGVSIGSSNIPAVATALQVSSLLTNSITSATGAAWDNVFFVAGTLFISGATTPITILNYFKITSPTINASSAVVVTDFYVTHIGAATFTGAGPASTTRNWSLGIDGNTKFAGGQNINGTDVNVAGPYTILATDYVLEVRRTATAAISLNLPSIATVGNGHIVISKDSGYNAAVNNITLVRNGADTIENVAGNYVQNGTGSAVFLKANATTNNWEIL